MSATACAVDGCNRPTHARGLCPAHYRRNARHGTPGPAHLNPRGTHQIGYRGAHARVTKARGPATDHACLACGEPAEAWAYLHTSPLEQTGPVRDSRTGRTWQARWSPDPDDFEALCWRCHRELDTALRPRRTSTPKTQITFTDRADSLVRGT